MWRATVLTIFPEMFPGPLGASLAGKALATGLWALDAVDIRTYATDKHRSVDDTPAGGGPGMVLRADVLARCVDAVAPASDARPRLVMSARGAPLSQDWVEGLAPWAGAIILCGRFEGIDQRLIRGRSFEEVSVGDYVLSGGEIAAFAVLDACVRLLPGSGKEASGAEGELRPWVARIPAIHPAAALGGPADPRCSPPATTPRSRRGGTPSRAGHEAAPAGPLGGPSDPRRPAKTP
jgi:tRNA (guanine37-N1)-methyltransferase